MKKTILLFSLAILFSCSSEESNDSNLQNIQYFFEIEFGGETHRIAGENTQMFTNGQNQCTASLQQGYQVIQFILNDITSVDFISGQPIMIQLLISNPQIGNNTGEIIFLTTPFLTSYAQNINTNFLGSNFVENSPMNAIEAIQEGVVGDITNISLVELGTAPSYSTALDGGNIKGSYEGVLYFIENGETNSNTNHDVAVPIKITFSAVRMN